MKKIISLLFLGFITIIAPLSVKANYYSIDQPVIDLNNHTLNEVFTDTINDLSQYEIPSILDYSVYEGLSLGNIVENYIDVEITELNGYTLKEVFEDNLIEENGLYTNVYRIGFNNVATYIGNENDYFYYVGQLDMISHNGSTSSNIQQTNLTSLENIDVYEIGINNWSFKGQYINDGVYRVRQDTGTDTYRVIYHYEVNITDLGISPTTDMDYYYSLYQAFNDVYVGDKSISFTTAPSQLQLDEWLSYYLDPSTIESFDMAGYIEVYKVGDSYYNLNNMKSDKVYSTFNLDTFDNLSETEISDQFDAWQTLGIEDITVLSLTEFQTFAPALDEEDMVYWYNYYNLILDYDEVQAGVLSDLEITILIITLVLFIIGIALAIYTKNRFIHVANGLLWFVPIVIVPNIFIIIFSVIMIITHSILAFYTEKEGYE